MQIGSIVMLSKSLPKGDKRLAKELGHDLPKPNEYYTIADIKPLYCFIQKAWVVSLTVEELVGEFDPEYFVEVQSPVKIDLNQLLKD